MRKMAPNLFSSTLFVCDVKKAKEKKRTTFVKMADGAYGTWEQLLPLIGLIVQISSTRAVLIIFSSMNRMSVYITSKSVHIYFNPIHFFFDKHCIASLLRLHKWRKSRFPGLIKFKHRRMNEDKKGTDPCPCISGSIQTYVARIQVKGHTNQTNKIRHVQ
jgi:hypothetical protein